MTLPGGPFDITREPQLLRLGKQFETSFRGGYLGEGSFGESVEIQIHAAVVMSRGTARWQVVDYVASGSDSLTASIPMPIIPIVICRIGFVDLLILYVDADGLNSHVVVEVKNTDWDRCSKVISLAARHRRQIWGYLEPLVYRADMREIGYPQAFVVYPRRPTGDRGEQLETYFGEYGVIVTYAEDLLGAPDSDNPPTGRSPAYLLQRATLMTPPACAFCSPGTDVKAMIIRETGTSARDSLEDRHAPFCVPVASRVQK